MQTAIFIYPCQHGFRVLLGSWDGFHRCLIGRYTPLSQFWPCQQLQQQTASNVCFAACEWQLAQSVKSEAEAVTEKLMEALKQHISVSITADDFSEALRRLFANKAASN